MILLIETIRRHPIIIGYKNVTGKKVVYCDFFLKSR